MSVRDLESAIAKLVAAKHALRDYTLETSEPVDLTLVELIELLDMLKDMTP